MQKYSTRTITFTALFTGLVFLATRFLAFPSPIPPAYINLGDSVIIVCAVLLGSKAGLFAGAVGSTLADIAFGGASIFAPITFVVKGLEGFIVGIIARKKTTRSIILASVIGVTIMVAGYFLGAWLVLSLFDDRFGIIFAVSQLPFDGIQAVANGVLGILLSLALRNKVRLSGR